MLLFAALILLLVILIGGRFIVKKSRIDHWLSWATTARRAMQDELAHDGVDEDDPMVKDVVQAARERGEV